MPKQYGKDTDLIRAVIDCKSRRLSYAEAVAELNRRGFKINEKKYQRVLAFIKKTIPQRLEDLPSEEYLESVIESIDMIDSMITIYWQMVKESKDNWQKSQILAMIQNCLITREKFYESSHVVSALARKLKGESGNVPK